MRADSENIPTICLVIKVKNSTSQKVKKALSFYAKHIVIDLTFSTQYLKKEDNKEIRLQYPIIKCRFEISLIDLTLCPEVCCQKK